MDRRILLVIFAACTACAPAVRFSATRMDVSEGPPFGPVELVADQCHWNEVAHEGVAYAGIEFTSSSELGTMIFLGRERGGPTILPTGGRGLAVIWRIASRDVTPAVWIPASDCEVFDLTLDTSARLGGRTFADFEIRCTFDGGATFVGKGRFTESCL